MRQQWVAGQMKHWQNLIHGDSGTIDKMPFPKMDFCITCPPYMERDDKWNPLYLGNPDKATYAQYLSRMGFIFGKLQNIMQKNATVVIQADNLYGRKYTPLVADLARCMGKHMRLNGEIVVAWDGGREEYRHTHCLVFKNTSPD